MTHHVTMKTNYSCKKNFSSKKRCTIFCDNFFLTTCAMKNFFASFFIHAFLRVKKISLKKVFIILYWKTYFS